MYVAGEPYRILRYSVDKHVLHFPNKGKIACIKILITAGLSPAESSVLRAVNCSGVVTAGSSCYRLLQ